MFDLQVPFFLPLWRRLLTIAMALGWAGIEVAYGGPGWAMIFGAIGAWAAYQFLIVWDPDKAKKGEKDG